MSRNLKVKEDESIIQPIKKGIDPPRAFIIQSNGGLVFSLIGGIE